MTDSPTTDENGKLSITVFSGDFDRVHYALAMAAAAAAINRPVTMLFTMRAIGSLSNRGWAGLTTGDGTTAPRYDDWFESRNLATFEELLAACDELGVRFIVCEMGLTAIGLTAEDLRNDIAIEIAGLITFFHDAESDGHMVFV